MTEEEYKTLYTIIHSLIFDSITEYQKNEFYLNRENFFIKNTESSEISFLQNELSELKRTFSNFKNQRSLILNDFEKVFPEKDFDKEFDRWSEMEANLIENIDFVKNKLILENDLQKVKRIKVKESPQIEFKDFFDPKVSDSAIKAIKEEYKDVKGKRLAILIYVLSKENMIRIISGDKAGNSRNDFIKSLNPEIKKTQGVNHYLSDFGNLDLKFISENDPDFISISEKVKTIIKESV